MMGAAEKASMVSAFLRGFDLLSTPCVFHHTKLATDANINAAVRTMGPQDEAIVNAFGIDAKVVTLKFSDFASSSAPEKFDTVTIGGEKMVLDSVHVHRVNDVAVFYKGYVRGHTR